MKKNIFLILLCVCVSVTGFSQETDSQEADAQEGNSQKTDVQESDLREKNLYTFFTNVIVTERFRLPLIGQFPLIGLVNIVKGDYNDAHLGLINWNTGNFTGLQLGFSNIVGGNANGMRAGFVNMARGDGNGLQVGFVNTVGGNENGLLAGFVNIIGGNGNGLYAGFVNAVGGNGNGLQAGFVNAVAGKTSGVQLGFVNVAAKGIKGYQTGFFNYADRVESGIPIGVISIVRNGGYQAVEYGFSELYPVQVALKLGVEKFYTSIIGACDFDGENLAFGFGIGKIIKMGNVFFFNPEINLLNTIAADGQMFLSFLPFFGYNLTQHFSIVLGPSITWTFIYLYDGGILEKPLVFSIYEYSIDSGNRITIGAKAGLRFRL
jgi:hypothetical protein